MRPLIIAGLVVLCLGAFLFFRGGTVTTRRDVLEVGDVKVTANEERSIPPWLAGATLLTGLGLIVAGAWKRA
jgi:hypothetical protein